MKPTEPWQFAALAAAIIAALILLLITLSKPSAAASFNCWRSKTATEATVCGDPLLSGLDSRLADAYRGSEISTWSQRNWLRMRDRCGVSRRCLERAYMDRIRRLEHR